MGSYVRPLDGGWLFGLLKGRKTHFQAPTILLLLFTKIEGHSIYPVFLLYSLYSITHRKKKHGKFLFKSCNLYDCCCWLATIIIYLLSEYFFSRFSLEKIIMRTVVVAWSAFNFFISIFYFIFGIIIKFYALSFFLCAHIT